jgi:DNA repair protein RadC
MRVREIEIRYKAGINLTEVKTIDSPEAVYKVLRSKLEDMTRELFFVLCLDNKNRMYGYNIVSMGTVSESLVHPREVFQVAEAFKEALITNSCSIIVAHNHPSGITLPSKEDISTTKRLVEAGKILGIPLLDHIIIGNNSYASMMEQGYM